MGITLRLHTSQVLWVRDNDYPLLSKGLLVRSGDAHYDTDGGRDLPIGRSLFILEGISQAMVKH